MRKKSRLVRYFFLFFHWKQVLVLKLVFVKKNVKIYWEQKIFSIGLPKLLFSISLTIWGYKLSFGLIDMWCRRLNSEEYESLRQYCLPMIVVVSPLSTLMFLAAYKPRYIYTRYARTDLWTSAVSSALCRSAVHELVYLLVKISWYI